MEYIISIGWSVEIYVLPGIHEIAEFFFENNFFLSSILLNVSSISYVTLI